MNALDARFCDTCGASLGAAVHMPGPTALAPVTTLAAQMALRTPTCVRCGTPVAPVNYFTRPANLAKLVVAMWFGLVPSFVFYFLRREQLICANCGVKREPRPEPEALLAGLASQGLMTVLPPRNPDADRALVDGRRMRRAGIFAGVMGVGWLGLAAASGMEGGAISLAFGLALGAISGIQLWRGGRLGRIGEALQKKHDALRVLQLAAVRGGRLRIAEVAAGLAMDPERAERTLDAMVDGVHISLEVDGDGRVEYQFAELQKRDA